MRNTTFTEKAFRPFINQVKINMKRVFFTNTVVLTITTQLLRIIGLFYIAFMSDKIGTEGIGLYQLIFSVYFLASTLATSGISVAVSKLSAESLSRSGHRSISNAVSRAALFSFLLGSFAAAALFLSSGFIGTDILGDNRAVISLKMLSWGLPFMAITSSFRGYFLGIRKALIPASEMIFEQAVQLIILFAIINSFIPKGLEYACLAIAISAAATEAISCGYIFVIYIIQKNKSKLAVICESDINRQILHISAPVAVTAYLRSGLRTAENVLIPMGLRGYGASKSEALSMFGLIGMAMPVLLFPSSFLTAISAVLLPEIAAAKSINDHQKIQSIFSKVFKLTTILSLLFSGIFICFAGDLGILIYQNKNTGLLILLLAPLVPLIYLDFIVDSMLNGLNQQINTLKINTLDYTIRIGLILLLVPRFGFFAYIAIYYLSTILNAFLSIRRLLIAGEAKIKFLDWVVNPALSVMAAGLITKLLFRLISTAYLPGLIMKVILMTALYFVFLFILQCLSISDISWFKTIAHKNGGVKSKAINNEINYNELLK